MKCCKNILTYFSDSSILPLVTREESEMMYIYDPEKIDELLEKIKDDDSVTLTGSQLRELAETIRKKGKGRKPIALEELKRAAKEEKAELKELRKQVKAEAREVKEAVKDKADETISAHKMEKEIRRENIAAKIDHKKEVSELRKTVEAEAEAIKAGN